MDIVGIDHVALRVSDLERAVAFYQSVLGLSVERRRNALGMIQMRAGASLIDLIGSRERADRQAGGGLDHLCLRVADFDPDKIRKTLECVDVEVGPVASRYGSSGDALSLYLTDTEGNGLELRA